MEQISLNSIVQRNDKGVVFTPLDDEIIMMDVDNGNYIKLNKTACSIWELIKEPIMVSKLISNLQNLFHVSNQICTNDTIACLHKMKELALLA